MFVHLRLLLCGPELPPSLDTHPVPVKEKRNVPQESDKKFHETRYLDLLVEVRIEPDFSTVDK